MILILLCMTLFLPPALGFGIALIYFLVIEPNLMWFAVTLVAGVAYFWLYAFAYNKLRNKYPHLPWS